MLRDGKNEEGPWSQPVGRAGLPMMQMSQLASDGNFRPELRGYE